MTYTKSPEYFVGFVAGTNGGCTTTNNTHNAKSGSSISATSCKLQTSEFVLGLANTFGETTYGYNISHDDNSPKAKAGGSCNNSHCATKATCEAAEASHSSCGVSPSGTANAVWTPGKTISDLCSN